MKNIIIFLMSVIFLTVTAEPAWCVPNLACIENGIEKIIDGFENFNPFFIEDGEKKFFAEDSKCFLRKNDQDLLSYGYAPVNHTVRNNNNVSQRVIVRIEDSSGMYAWNRIKPESFHRLWDKEQISNAVGFLAWYEPGSNLLPLSDLIPIQYRDKGITSRFFSLDIEAHDNGGYPLLFFIKNNEFIPPELFGEENDKIFRSLVSGQMDIFENADNKVRIHEIKDVLGNRAIHYAAAFGHEEILKKLIADGAGINDRGENNMTPLLTASAAGHETIAAILLKHNANARAADHDKRTALHYASYLGHDAIVEEVSKYVRNLNEEDSFGFSPVTYAINAGNDTTVGTLASKNVRFRPDRENIQLLLLDNASRDNSYNTVSFLLDRGARADREIYGTTPLVVAAGNARLETVALLVDSGAKVNRRNSRQVTPLLNASLSGKPVIVRYLLEKGADVNTQSETGLTPLEAAVLLNNTEIIDLLIKYGVDINKKDQAGYSLLWKAVMLGHRESLKKLLDSGVEFDLKRQNITGFMESAFRYDLPEALDLALKQGLKADFMFHDKFHSTLIADYFSAGEILNLLSQHGVEHYEETGSIALTPFEEIYEKPQLIDATPIYYPLELKRKYGSRRFVVRAIIDEEGSVLFPKIIESEIPEIDRIVIESITTWRFTPPKNSLGETCSVTVNIPILLESEDIEQRTWDLSEVDQAPRILKASPPRYPREYVSGGIQGRVVLSIIIGETGTPEDVSIVSMTHEGFADAAIEAARGYQFSPAYYQGNPVKVRVRVPIVFSLD